MNTRLGAPEVPGQNVAHLSIAVAEPFSQVGGEDEQRVVEGRLSGVPVGDVVEQLEQVGELLDEESVPVE